MLARPRLSCVVLLNLTRKRWAEATGASAGKRAASLSLLPICRDVFDVTPLVAGDCAADVLPPQVRRAVEHINEDALSLWQIPDFTQRLAARDAGVIFLGGAFLEEEVLVVALEGARHGYEIRLLADLAYARTEHDRPLVLGRLAHHGIVATTIRQVLFEWAVSCGDRAKVLRVQQLLS